MIAVIDLKAELAKLKMLRGRSAETTAAEREGAFARLAPYRDGAIFSAKFQGDSPWERHPNGDEIVHIVEGSTVMHLMTAEGPVTVTATAGTIVIVPQNTWHRFEAPDGVTLMTATPQPTQHLDLEVEDPRTVE
jgi:mannose-6-phosphate isomerase-like protein (cupin superfamily)